MTPDQKTIERLKRELACEKKRRRKVLVVGITGDDVGGHGRVEVYAEDGVAVRCERQVFASREKNKDIAEAILEEKLPKFWREIYFPGNLRQQFVNAPFTASAAMDSQLIKVAMIAIDEYFPA